MLQKNGEVRSNWIDRNFYNIQLNKCIRNYPKYYEAYIYRGKLYLKLKQYRPAMADFDKAIALDGNKQIAYIGKGDCLRLMEKY